MADLYRCKLLDPPWLERGGGKSKRGADRHYPLMSTPDIIATIYQSGAWRPDPTGCHVWMWVTDNFLADGLRVMEALGVRYLRTFPWIKVQQTNGHTLLDLTGQPLVYKGLGQYARGASELLLLGRYGKTLKPLDSARSTSNVIFAPRGRHSAKPAESYHKIEAISPGPRMELFSRTPREGWDAWGNEIEAISPAYKESLYVRP